jgi:hypothetical protein
MAEFWAKIDFFLPIWPPPKKFMLKWLFGGHFNSDETQNMSTDEVILRDRLITIVKTASLEPHCQKTRFCSDHLLFLEVIGKSSMHYKKVSK